MYMAHSSHSKNVRKVARSHVHVYAPYCHPAVSCPHLSYPSERVEKPMRVDVDTQIEKFGMTLSSFHISCIVCIQIKVMQHSTKLAITKWLQTMTQTSIFIMWQHSPSPNYIEFEFWIWWYRCLMWNSAMMRWLRNLITWSISEMSSYWQLPGSMSLHRGR